MSLENSGVNYRLIFNMFTGYCSLFLYTTIYIGLRSIIIYILFIEYVDNNKEDEMGRTHSAHKEDEKYKMLKVECV
jgi:hypothetical protein